VPQDVHESSLHRGTAFCRAGESCLAKFTGAPPEQGASEAGGHVQKMVAGLPVAAREILFSLLLEIERCGPVRGNWPNYGKLGKNRHHCHLKRGRPTYVAVWEVTNRAEKTVELTYVGSHEKAPY
jgi:hypothetical protein